ncbi:tetratricopeptide repeat protein [Mesorhizobium robiniae]
MHMLGYLYGCHGQAKRGAAYLFIAAQLAPEDAGVLRTLAHLLILDGEPEKALATIGKLETIDGPDHPGLTLLKSRALLAAGRPGEARQSFRWFLDNQMRNGHA